MKIREDSPKGIYGEKSPAPARKPVRKPVSFKEAKKHVFTTYRDVLEKLAK